jgi:hypothetical protein
VEGRDLETPYHVVIEAVDMVESKIHLRTVDR